MYTSLKNIEKKYYYDVICRLILWIKTAQCIDDRLAEWHLFQHLTQQKKILERAHLASIQ